jgi:hypothetical protein
VRDAGALVTVQLTGDDTQERAAVGGGEQLDRTTADVLVARRHHLVLGRQVHPQLEPVEETARHDERLRRSLDVQEARARRHPLGVAVGDGAAATVGVLVVEDSVNDVGHGLEAAVGVPGGALGLARRVLHLAHLVHHDERVEVAVVDPGERAANREALALEAARRGGHGEHGAGHGLGRRRDAGQGQRVLDGHCRHVGTSLCSEFS